MNPAIVRVVTILGAAWFLFHALWDLPFSAIEQSSVAVCQPLDGTMCIRLSSIAAALITYFFALTGTEQLSKNTLVTSDVSKGISGGLLGAGVAFASFVFNLLIGSTQFRDFQSVSILDIVSLCVGMICTGFSEELFFRGIFVGIPAQVIDPRLAVVLSSILFGAVHVKYSYVYGLSALMSGLLLGFGFLQWGFYWSAGFHSAFNIVETFLYSATKTVPVMPLLSGERKTPDDDGLMTVMINAMVLMGLLSVG